MLLAYSSREPVIRINLIPWKTQAGVYMQPQALKQTFSRSAIVCSHFALAFPTNCFIGIIEITNFLLTFLAEQAAFDVCTVFLKFNVFSPKISSQFSADLRNFNIAEKLSISADRKLCLFFRCAQLEIYRRLELLVALGN